MGFTNSPLISYKRISPNKTSPRNHKIDTITIHCYVGQASVESMGNWLCSPKAQASSNYGIGKDGRIALFVEEKDRSWCSSSSSNDNRAITIECACDKAAPFAVNDDVYNSLIKLITDICKRNNITELKWKGDKSLIGQIDKQNMTVHKWFKNKDCPGEYLYSRHDQIAAEVNRRLNGEAGSSDIKLPKTPFTIDVLIDDLNYRSQPSMSGDVKGQTGIGTFTIIEASNGWGKLKSGVGWVWLGNPKYCTVEMFKQYSVKVIDPKLNIRKGPGTNYEKTGGYTGTGVFTIIDESPGAGSNKGWGKLKSGAGWISLDYTVKI